MRLLAALAVSAVLIGSAEAAPWASSTSGTATFAATQVDETDAYTLTFACDHAAAQYVLTLSTPDPPPASPGTSVPLTFIPDDYLLDPVTMTAENEASHLAFSLRAGIRDKPFGALADALATVTQAIEVRLDDKLLSFSAENASYAIGHVTYLCLN